MDHEVEDAFREMEEAAERIKARSEIDIREKMIGDLYRNAEDIAGAVVSVKSKSAHCRENKIDDMILSRRYGYPLMLLLLGTVFWLTIVGANVPSSWLGDALFGAVAVISDVGFFLGVPEWLHHMVVYGVFQCLAWVVAVMLPPMAIFFTLFTLLEEWGYLPRVAMSLDHLFYRSCACGKQALTMCMGFGCNAAGVVSCRIIDSPRERILAMVTNAFVPCNGRFPTLLLLATFIVGGMSGAGGSNILVTAVITGVVLMGITVTFLVSKLLADTILKGEPSTMILELPPYRMPQIKSVLYHSLWERTRLVLWRAVCVAAPAGMIIWILAHTTVGDNSLLLWSAEILDPIAWHIGLDGAILLAFILGIPANEIVLPILLMIYLATGQMTEIESARELGNIFALQGWTVLTLINTSIFCLFHWPCATTLLSVYQESRSIKWTMLAFLLPTVIGMGICFLTAQSARLLGLV